LGAWDIEKEASHAAIAGRKLYALYTGNEVKKLSSKGGSLSLEEIKRICQGDTIQYFNQAPTFSLRNEPRFISRRFRSTVDLSDLGDFAN
jgi:hypothetical protein